MSEGATIDNNSSRKKFSRRKSFELYKHVIELRKQEFSYTEIRKETGLAKSTINNWLAYAGLTLSKQHLEIQNRNNARNNAIGSAASKITRAKRREAEIQLFIQDIKRYFSDPFFVSGVMLYQAEGSKGDSNGFSNSDYRLTKAYIKFLEKYFLLTKEDNMSFKIYIHDSRKNDLQRIINFWTRKLQIDPEKIKISWKHNLVTKRRMNLNYVGQFEVRVRRFPYFTGKLLAVSDIMLRAYNRH